MSERCVIHCGDAIDVLATLPSESAHCCVTSPPYWGLRDYGVDGQIGLEASPAEYIAKMVEVFREVRRVLRKDGAAWLNIGDSYARNGGEPRGGNRELLHMEGKQRRMTSIPGTSGLKPKDLCMMPHRLAIALQDDGWYVRCDIVWSKPNPMPESVTDRPTRSHEYVFLLSKSERYFYDAEAVREKGNPNASGGPIAQSHRLVSGSEMIRSKKPDGWDTGNGAHGSVHRNGREAGEPAEIRDGRNKRSVWTIPTEPYSEAHFATFPQALVKPCILAGTSERGCCAECGAPLVRQVVGGKRAEGGSEYAPGDPSGATTRRCPKGGQKEWDARTPGYSLGWSASCKCDAGDPVPCMVLDPFCGSGTTGLVAVRYGRRFIGIELNREYVEMAETRIAPVLAQEQLVLA